jgi:hypothetical protein
MSRRCESSTRSSAASEEVAPAVNDRDGGVPNPYRGAGRVLFSRRLYPLPLADVARPPGPSDLSARVAAGLGAAYRVERELGHGGMAIVFLAEDVRHRRRVAIKVLRPELARSLGVERFLREIALVAPLAHPNVLPLYDSGELASDLLYYVTPYEEDDSLPHQLGPGALVESVSADGRWVAMWDLGLVDRILVSPAAGGPPTVICTECVPPSFERMPWPPAISWSPDGRFVYLSLYGASYAVPLSPGHALPRIPTGGLKSERVVAELPGALRIAPQRVYPGPDPSRWAFTKVTIERNIYRVPLP